MEPISLTPHSEPNCQWEMIDHLDEGLAVCSPDGNTLLKVNEIFAHLHDYSVKELEGECWQKLVIPSQQQQWNQGIQAALARGKHSWQTQHYSAQGEILPVIVTVKAIADPPENLKYYLIIVKLDSQPPRESNGLNLQEDQQQGEELHQREFLLQNTLNNSPHLVYIYDLVAHRNIYVNGQTTKILGYSPLEIQQTGSQLLTNLIYPEDWPIVQKRLERIAILKDGEILELEYRILHKNGSIRWLKSREVIFSRNPDSSPAKMLGYALDITETKQAQKQLQFQAQLLDNVRESVIATDLKGQVIYWSKGAEQLYGYTAAEVMGKLILFIVEPQDQEQEEKRIAEVIEQGYWRGEYWQKRKDGSLFWADTSLSLVKDENGNPIGIIGIDRDVTESKLIEQILKESESRFRAIFEQAAVGMTLTSASGQMLRVNQKFSQFMGYSESELLGKTWLQITAPEDIGISLLYFNQLLTRKQEFFSLEKRYIRADGQIVWGNIHVSSIYNSQGELQYYLVVIEDISERKRAEEELRESEYRFRAIFQKAALGIAEGDFSGKIIRANPGLCQILGYSEAELLELNFQDFTHPEDLIQELKLIDQLLANHIHYYSLEKRYIRKDNQVRWVKVTVSLFRDLLGQPVYFIGLIEDIEEQKRARLEMQQAKEAAEAANLAKSQFLANMSHELRTPLNAILGFSQIMARSSVTPAEHQKYLEIVTRSGEHLLSLINDILDLAKIESGKSALNPESFELLEMLNSLKNLFSLRATEKQLQLNFEIDGDVPKVIQSDSKKLRSSLMNLLDNALKFTECGSITLKVSMLDPRSRIRVSEPLRLCFEVEDTGLGIAPEDIDHIFDAFVQTRTGQKALEGTGLGLTITQHYVKMMGGQITVTSTLGVGSSFQFDIPVYLANSSNQIHFARVIHPNENDKSLKNNQVKSSDCPDQVLSNSELKYQISTMNLPWIKSLHQAALSARERKIIELIDELPQENISLKKTLTHLINKLAFEEIANITHSYQYERKPFS